MAPSPAATTTAVSTSARPPLPVGTVTFLFTDVEGSTQLLNAHPDAYRSALMRHHDLLAASIRDCGGAVFETVGDAVYAAFARPTDAVRAALGGQLALAAEDWGAASIRVRMGVHLGEVELQFDRYFGAPLYRCARLMATAHGGQVVLSEVVAAAVRDSLPEGASLRDLGEHRLKDLARPERVFQVLHPRLRAEFPPLRSLDARPNNLPAQATRFIGRDRELPAVVSLLSRPDVRLLTLTGPGGTGKTRLALQAAADVLEDFPDGVFFVPLAPITDEDGVLPAAARALGLGDRSGAAASAALREHLRDKRLLLVLDNFEQVAGAAPTVSELLAACPCLKVMVTSRALLRLYGEHDFPVPPLALPERRPLPPIERLTQYEAVALFVHRAVAVRPDFTVTNQNAPAVAEICHRLDGLPLAIELAAARARLLPPEAMLARLERRLPLLTGGPRDLPARQQTLRNTIAWSFDLLDPAEQTLFLRLGAFSGGCTLDAIDAVCNCGDLGAAVLDGIESLLDKSLVLQAEYPDREPRFSMLETIREFALERLEACGDLDATLRRHTQYYLLRAQRSAQELWTWQQSGSLWTLDLDRHNLRAALERTSAQDIVDRGLQFVLAVLR